MLRDYYQLIKPGIVYGNAMTALAAFVFASFSLVGVNGVSISLLTGMLLGLSLTIAGACVANNIFDRDIDARMERTKDRALPTGRVSIRTALILSIVLEVLGIGILYRFTNPYALFITLFGVFVYLVLYTPAKRITPHSTVIGSLSGAVPPVVGYTAVANTFDNTALLLLLILVCWQMVHFFAIAIFRRDEYGNASLPIMTVRFGILETKLLMATYTLLLTYAIFLLAFVEALSLIYVVPMALLCSGWIVLAFSGFRKGTDELRWARTMFFYSLLVLTLFSVTLALSSFGGA